MIQASIAVVLTLALQAQTPVAGARPDFSGRWTDVSAAPAQPGQARQAAPGGRAGAPPVTMGSGWLTPFTITQTATHLTVEYAFFSRGDMQPPLKFAYALDVPNLPLAEERPTKSDASRSPDPGDRA